MKVAGRVFRNNKISYNNEKEFTAIYKKHDIDINMIEDDELDNDEDYCGTREFNIEVRAGDGMFTVDTVEDFTNIKEAIEYALEGATL